MDFLTSLWAPILLSAAVVWVASAIIWMVMPHHRKDYIGLPDEKAFMDYIREKGIPPGNYGFPHFGSHKECNSPEAKQKWKEGPVGLLSVWGQMSMARNMVLTFITFLVVSTLIAYLAHVTLEPGDPFALVFRVTGTAGVLAYSFAFIPNGIWFGQYPRAIAACVVDGIAYGLLTGAVFGWLWPGA